MCHAFHEVPSSAQVIRGWKILEFAQCRSTRTLGTWVSEMLLINFFQNLSVWTLAKGIERVSASVVFLQGNPICTSQICYARIIVEVSFPFLWIFLYLYSDATAKESTLWLPQGFRQRDRCKIFPVFVFGDAGGATSHLGRRRICRDHFEFLGLGRTTLGPHMPYAIYMVNS